MQTKKNRTKLKSKTIHKIPEKKVSKLLNKSGGSKIFSALAPRSVKKGIRSWL